MASKELLDFNDIALKSHNNYRKNHGVCNLKLSEECRKSAQDWSEKLVKMDKLENSPTSCSGAVGENISSRKSGAGYCDISGSEVSDQWYADINKYDFNTHTGNSGNFTQLVWSGSTEVGFGKAHHNGKCVVVAHYKPAGNIRGKYREHVPCSKISPGGHGGAVEMAVSEPTADGNQEVNVGIVPEETPEEPLPKPTKTTIETVTVNEPDGKSYKIRKETDHYEDDLGNIRKCVREIRLDDDDKNKGSSSGTSCSDEEKKKEMTIFAKALIDSHNQYRQKHSAPPLARNKDLDKMAQEWAEHLVRMDRISNSNYTYKGNRLGENITSRWSNGPCDSTGHEVTENWYSENGKFDYDSEPTNVQGIGNFTQLIWKNSREIGVGKAIHSSHDGTKVITVCLYHPAGNVLQCFKENCSRAN